MIEYLFLETGFPVHVCLIFAAVYILINTLHEDNKDEEK